MINRNLNYDEMKTKASDFSFVRKVSSGGKNQSLTRLHRHI